MGKMQDNLDLLKDRFWSKLTPDQLIAIERAKDELRVVVEKHGTAGVLGSIELSAEHLIEWEKRMNS